MAMGWSQCVPQLKLDGIRIPRDLIQNQIEYPLKKLGFRMGRIALRPFFLQFLHRIAEALEHISECRVSIQPPSISIGERSG